MANPPMSQALPSIKYVLVPHLLSDFTSILRDCEATNIIVHKRDPTLYVFSYESEKNGVTLYHNAF